MEEFQNYLFDILDQVKNGITVTDPHQEDNPIIYVNLAFIKIFGYTKEDVMGKNCRFLQADDREQSSVKKIKNAIKDRKGITTIVRNYSKNGDLIYNEISISPIFDKKSGVLKYFVGIQKDVTREQRLIQELQSLI